ncbi:maker183 [Drosophila busckii]|uniref:Maker183 n=1 Tax=Drosophila busckii TaxID=30019 RepID=A0A0M5JCA0_DROBS|nr:glutathione S-transferase 1-1 [Drosophila busckii]ALC46044.1 maker183 [Drosophila busckii]
MDLYAMPASAPCRSVIMLAEALGIKFNLKVINTMEGEQLKPEYLKINPQHTIPTIVEEDGFTLWESRAILAYLVEKYGKDDLLYPKDPQQRALVNQRLYFDMGVLNEAFKNYFYPQFRENKPADPELFKKVEDGFELFNTFLEGQQYAAGSQQTIADYALLATVSTCQLMGVQLSKFPNVDKWYQHVSKTTPGFEASYKIVVEMKTKLEAMKKAK